MTKTFVYSTKLNKTADFVAKTYSVPKDISARPNIKVSKNPVFFPINTVSASFVGKGDDVRVIILKNYEKSDDGSGLANADEVAKICRDECERVFSEAGCKCSFTEIPIMFDGTSDNIGKCYLDLLNALEYKTEIYLDMTFGPKFVPFVVFSAFNYAEKFFKSDACGIYYGQVYFNKDRGGDSNGDAIKAGSEELHDLSSIYRLSSFCDYTQSSSAAFKFFVKELFV